ncbi:MAG: peptidylprolyl isomerase [Deltaproteobacteria bacterium]|nr:peptidylprolyl isomerase [Deltaproteobacteria bacterium]MBW2071852.1 peptidylprolyl isomerase [Deltaproteobacteria bacterium]
MFVKTIKGFCAVVLSITLLILASQVSAASDQKQGTVVARVNGTDISQSDFDSEMSRVLDRMQTSGKAPSNTEMAKLRQNVLDQLIARELLYQEARKKGIKPDQKTVDEQYTALEGRFPSENDFKAALTAMGLNETKLKSQLERNLAIKELVDTRIVKDVAVTDAETKAYYDSHPDLFRRPAQVRASHILVKLPANADDAQKAAALKKIKAVQEKVKKGGDFSALAKEYSEGPSAEKGGDLGYFGRGQMVVPFEKAAFALQPGQVSDVVQTRFGYHLIKVTDKKPESQIAYADIKERLGNYLKQQKVQQEVKIYVDDLKKEADIKEFLK